jgi:hypothetical protein
MKLHKINRDQRLYVMPCGGGFSCYGFDVLDRKGRALAAELGEVWTERKGTKKAFKRYAHLLEMARKINAATKRRFNYELSPQLIGFEGRRVEVVTTYGEMRRFWVGKSTGFCPCHLEIARRDSTGGGAAEREYKSVKCVSTDKRR